MGLCLWRRWRTILRPLFPIPSRLGGWCGLRVVKSETSTILVGPRHRCARSGHGEAAARIFRRILDALQFRVGGPEHLKPASADVLKYRRCFDQVAEGGVWIKIKCHGAPLGSTPRAIERKGPCLYVCTEGSRRACGVGACARLLPTKSDPWETSGPQIDRIPSTHPPWRRRQYRELKKLIFSAPRKCPIDLFGPVASRTVLKRLHAAFRVLLASVSHAAS